MAKFAQIWCRTMHDSPMWPSHGRYECRTCGREYPVPWEREAPAASWQNKKNEKRITGMLLAPGPNAHAAQMTRPS